MPFLEFHCPHCGGRFQIDPSLAGGQAACPFCGGVAAIPEVSPPPGPSPPAAPPPSQPYSAPAGDGSTSQFACPACSGVFQAAPEMAGGEVSCPHCGEAVLLPGVDSDPPLPPGESPPAWERSGDDDLDDLPPPAAPAESAPDRAPSDAEVEDLLPPELEAAPTGSVETSPESEPLDVPHFGDDAERPESNAPPGAERAMAPPTEEGSPLALREPVKVIQRRGRQIELRPLSPKEKARRRFWRNVYFAAFGIVFLIVVMFVLATMGGAW